uniref:Uncharacterized protein n=1 Tax=Podoviridae sp. ctz6O13 TaxID=2827757 RepID=A0A8S5TKZ4_9CAUD|nr:MAG TPA: hypothetical protein [Podoviridae sp. ctz6O13]
MPCTNVTLSNIIKTSSKKKGSLRVVTLPSYPFFVCLLFRHFISFFYFIQINFFFTVFTPCRLINVGAIGKSFVGVYPSLNLHVITPTYVTLKLCFHITYFVHFPQIFLLVVTICKSNPHINII